MGGGIGPSPDEGESKMIAAKLHSGQVMRRWLERARSESREGSAAEAKRGSKRINWVVSVHVGTDIPGGEKRLRSRTRDISEKGLGVVCREEISIGTPVRVYPADSPTTDEYIEGRVDHCTMTVGGYKIGIRVNC